MWPTIHMYNVKACGETGPSEHLEISMAENQPDKSKGSDLISANKKKKEDISGSS